MVSGGISVANAVQQIVCIEKRPTVLNLGNLDIYQKTEQVRFTSLLISANDWSNDETRKQLLFLIYYKKNSTSTDYEILDDNQHHNIPTTTNTNSRITLSNDNSSSPPTSNTTNSSSNNNITTQSSDTTNPTTTSSIHQNFPNRKSQSSVWLYATKSEDGKSATCNLCGYACAVVSHSTSTIRYHLIRQHDKYDLIISPSSSSSKSKVSQHLKNELHSLCYNAIIIDHRPFNDMRKPGLLAIFNKLCPGIKDYYHYSSF
ncbi:unnamed protein product [Rotaria sp. Silwood2]|nr:unnamed protein product [Rotaria sp. Silwood2]